MNTTDRIIDALREGQQTVEQLSRTSSLSASQTSSAIRVLQNRGVVGYLIENGQRFYYLTGGGS